MIAEYPQKTGWGHTPAEWAVDYAVAARAKRLALTHHDPIRDDEALDRLVEMCRRRASAAGSGLEVFAAAEGQELRFIKRDAQTLAAALPPEPARKVGPHTILVADDDPTILRLLTLTLEQDAGVKMHMADMGIAYKNDAIRSLLDLALASTPLAGAIRAGYWAAFMRMKKYLLSRVGEFFAELPKQALTDLADMTPSDGGTDTGEFE